MDVVDVTPEQLAAILINDEPGVEPAAPPVTEEVKTDAATPPAKEEPKPDPKELERQERVARRIETARRAELQASKERREAERVRAEAEALRTKMDGLKSNPLEALREIGLDPQEFLQRVVDDGKPSPDAVVKELRAQIEQINKERQEEREQLQRAQVQTRVYKALDEFVDLVGTNAEKYPNLTDEFTPEEIARQAYAYGQQYGRQYVEATGEDLTDEVIASKLEELAARRAATRQAWRDKVKPKQASRAPSVSAQSGNGPQVNARPEAPRTLSNDMASERASAPKSWSQDDADAVSLEILRKAFSQV